MQIAIFLMSPPDRRRSLVAPLGAQSYIGRSRRKQCRGCPLEGPPLRRPVFPPTGRSRISRRRAAARAAPTIAMPAEPAARSGLRDLREVIVDRAGEEAGEALLIGP